MQPADSIEDILAEEEDWDLSPSSAPGAGGEEGSAPAPGLGLDVALEMESDWIVSPLTAADLIELENLGPEHAAAPVQHIRQFHHVVAKMEATGFRDFEIVQNLSISPVTLSNLRKSPLYAELVEYYGGEVTSNLIDLHTTMRLVSKEALLEIHERLCDPAKRGLIALKELRQLSESFADRTGDGPIRKVQTDERHTHGLDDETLAVVRERNRETPVLEEIPQGARPAMGRVSQFQSIREAEIVSDPEGGD